ncbi:hypothetical protein EHS25_005692 [Saitozyma podzolica]|uniref:Uncharacterized protein n=1 Tax=Saitozyma podzolica TaxID=1890683 RepID=A0A427XVX8_9TREE|nr:hypothetical protein EHS25_005692 [Saitozyma podzolica]
MAVGDMIYRLVTKAIIRHSERRDFLLPYHFGVGKKGGVEPVLSIRLNPAECKKLAPKDIRTNGPRMLGTCVGAYSTRERFLREKIDHEAATIVQLFNLPPQHAPL